MTPQIKEKSKEKIKDNKRLIKIVKKNKIKVELQIKNTNDFHQVKIYERDILIKNRLISDLEKENIEYNKVLLCV